MELRHLRYFEAVAELLNFSRAAERLRVAQPSLSRQIRALEDEMGVVLIDRSAGRVRLTDAGRVLHAHLGKVFAQMDIAVTAAQQAARGHDVRLVICNDWRLAAAVIPECVRAFRAEHPRVEVELADLPMHEQAEALRSGDIHLGFLPKEFVGVREDLDSFVVIRTELAAVLPSGHALAGRKSVRLIELADETWVWVKGPRASDHRNYLIQTSRLAGFSPSFGKPVASLEALLAHVIAGYGVTLVPEFVLPTHRQGLRVIPTDCDPLELCAVWRRGDSSQPLRHFLAQMRQQVRGGSTRVVDEKRPGAT